MLFHASPPTRILFLRPDTYGDLVLFEPVLRRLRDAWGNGPEIGVLIREPFLDFTPLVAVPGVRWLTIDANPYHDPVDSPAATVALAALREMLGNIFPADCIVAPCSGKTWLEAAAGMLLPGARQVGLRRFDLDPAVLDATARALGLEAEDGHLKLFTEMVDVDVAAPEWRQQGAMADYLLGVTTTDDPSSDGELLLPRLVVPPDAQTAAGAVLAANGLNAGGYVVCAAAGVANIQIKAWPPDRFGEILAWLGREHGVPALLVGHEREADRLEAARQAAALSSGGGPEPALWLGRDGEMPVLAALIGSSRFYLGNDTGAIHLAAALDRPLVGVYGGGAGLRFRPAARARTWTVVQPLPCFGCAWDCFFGDAPCVGTIPSASVQAAVQRLLATERDLEPPVPGLVEVGGLHPAARDLLDRVAPRFHATRVENADRYLQIRELDALARRRERELAQVQASSRAEAEALQARFCRAEADANARGEQVTELTGLLRAAETDRAARGEQVRELTVLLQTAEADRTLRGDQVTQLTAWLKESEADRAARLHQVEELTSLLAVSEADRAARGALLDQLAAQIRTTGDRPGTPGTTGPQATEELTDPLASGTAQSAKQD